MPVNLAKAQPENYRALVALTEAAQAELERVGVDARMRELVAVRTSQINGCAYCLRAHTRDAVEAGETADRLAVLPAWWESQYFSAQEQAALALAERVARPSEPPHHRVDGAALEGALDEAQTAALTWFAIVMNSWNRMALASGYAVRP
ncbi:carboxymuconolactone decarboxylase family protein [Actinomyces bowdenii]|uniref:Carboxymuconolactone decarboxylase family protein n=1 Tax=Actinomyces bowdenii TaxID=131109 RepID=A0A853EKY9_9ACTO|nr:carboxymuconolactone decarboxylase family protein [Actinomyces bowdenii]MBF0697332.1 carboxymuconolactone decarboxylase family protein [Actinomyces bowdenii]MDO5065186.1 carboxymuconolactone decarboxylase family protein [Actinomyces bowdenii]NYS69505.1 carboxymuconolactone decarboxylase family protein [Actinomyces bowdenii]